MIAQALPSLAFALRPAVGAAIEDFADSEEYLTEIRRKSYTDYIEYDIAVATGSPTKGFFYSPFKGNDSKDIKLDFKRGEGIDQFGREQVSTREPKGGAAVWEHRIIGLASYGPGILPAHALVFKAAKPGTYKVYIDNLRIRHADGSNTSIWAGAKDTRKPKLAETALFKDVHVRAVASPKFDHAPQ